MIELQGVVARVPPVALGPITATFGAGIHALLGGKDDGPSVLLGVVAGRHELRGGGARVLGFGAGDARVRPSVAYVPVNVALPEPLRVHEALAIAAEIRGERDRTQTLDWRGSGSARSAREECTPSRATKRAPSRSRRR